MEEVSFMQRRSRKRTVVTKGRGEILSILERASFNLSQMFQRSDGH